MDGKPNFPDLKPEPDQTDLKPDLPASQPDLKPDLLANQPDLKPDLPWKPSVFLRVVRPLARLKIKDYVLQWLFGEKWAFDMILVSILGEEGKNLVAECDHEGLQLKLVFHDGFDYFCKQEAERKNIFDDADWCRFSHVINKRLMIDQFVTKRMSKIVRTLRGPDPWKACQQELDFHKTLGSQVYIRDWIGVEMTKMLEKRNFVLRGNVDSFSLSRLMELRPFDILDLNEMLVLPSDGKHSVVVDKVTEEQVEGIFPGKIPDTVLGNMRDLLLVLHRIKPPVRKVEDKKMCSAGTYVASRFKKRKSADKDRRAHVTDLEEEKIDLKGEQVAGEDNATIKVKGEQEAKQTCVQDEEEEEEEEEGHVLGGEEKEAMQFYVTSEKLFRKYPGFLPIHQTLLEKYLHKVIAESMMALGVMACPAAFRTFLDIHKPYLAATAMDVLLVTYLGFFGTFYFLEICCLILFGIPCILLPGDMLLDPLPWYVSLPLCFAAGEGLAVLVIKSGEAEAADMLQVGVRIIPVNSFGHRSS
ncbi:hypothetical protein R1sor_025169 [Riccia sorocarpa]|uniref:Uncharacterized protein n=1 Tax=Riccia sorocarpa TaxID=122646 RepID=A0ABD3GBG3_9MARC